MNEISYYNYIYEQDFHKTKCNLFIENLIHKKKKVRKCNICEKDVGIFYIRRKKGEVGSFTELFCWYIDYFCWGCGQEELQIALKYHKTKSNKKKKNSFY